MAAALVKASGAEPDDLIGKYRDAKGAKYPDALVLAIPKLDRRRQGPGPRRPGPAAARFTAGTLNTMMTDKDRELRRAAALAAGRKGKDRLAEFATA